MSDFGAREHEFMAEALRLARRGLYSTQPNPRVGCVLVRNDDIVGRGWHRKAGEPHAEVHALHDAGESAMGATAYVTLEPCSHEGRTPSCANALAEAGVERVVAAVGDPNPEVNGAGFARLRNAGIVCQSGLLQTPAVQLNRGFFSRHRNGRPFVTAKIAASLDGRTAMKSGESQWISGEAARSDVQKLRAASGAIMSGIATVVADDPALTVRERDIDTGGRQPVRVILDSRLRMSPQAKMLGEPGDTLLFCIDDAKRTELESAGAKVIKVDEVDSRLDIHAVLRILAAQGVNDVLVEAGPVLVGNLLAQKLVDELVIYQSPHIMGSETRGMISTPDWTMLRQRQELQFVDVRAVGKDLKISARPI